MSPTSTTAHNLKMVSRRQSERSQFRCILHFTHFALEDMGILRAHIASRRHPRANYRRMYFVIDSRRKIGRSSSRSNFKFARGGPILLWHAQRASYKLLRPARSNRAEKVSDTEEMYSFIRRTELRRRGKRLLFSFPSLPPSSANIIPY